MEETTSYKLSDAPFGTVTVDKVFGSRERVESIKKAISRQSGWVKQIGAVHSFWSLPNISDLRELLNQYVDRFELHRLALQDHLSINLKREPSFDVFRLSDGDGIGFHDDANVRSTRMVVRIAPDKFQSMGGDFILSNGSLRGIYVVELDVDEGIALTLGPGKLHALSNIKGPDVTYLIVQFDLEEL